MSYSNFADKVTSRKEIICHIEPIRKLNVWVNVGGGIFKKKLDYYVIDAKENDTPLIEASSISLNSGEFFFDYQSFELYVRLSNDLSPDTVDLISTFRMFFSSIPYNLPHDMQDGNIVHYEPLFRSNSSLTSAIDSEQVGIALDAKVRVTMENEGGYFDQIFDRYVFEEKRLKLWSWSPSITLSEARPMFDGVIKTKKYEDTRVEFSANDLITQLKKPIGLEFFSESDGNLDEFDLDKPKRRIYGQVQQAQAIGIDKQLGKLELSDPITSGSLDVTISATEAQQNFTGSNFLADLSVGAIIQYRVRKTGPIGPGENPFVNRRVTVQSITDDNNAVAETNFDETITNQLCEITQSNIFGTNFLRDLTPEDELIFNIGDQEFKYSIQSVLSDTKAIVSERLDVEFNNIQAFIDPIIPVRYANSRFHIGSGKLFEKSTTITKVIDKGRYKVSSAVNLLAGDLIEINGETSTIRRISGNTIVLNDTISVLVQVNDLLTRPPVYKVQYLNETPIELFYQRDWTVTNGADVILELNDLAEFNATPERTFNFPFTFTKDSRVVSTTEDVNLKTELKPRDWIRSPDFFNIRWYEILEVKEKEIILREAYEADTVLDILVIKNISYISDESVLMVDCYGIEDNNGEWVKTGPDIARHLITEDANLQTDIQTFYDAALEIPYVASMIEPASVGGSVRKIKAALKDINESILGSVHTNSNLDIVYSVVDPRKPELNKDLKDDDILSWSVSTTNKIVRKVTAEYRGYIDRFTGEETFKRTSFTSSLVDRLVGTQDEKFIKLFLFNENDAQIMCQRFAFYNSLSSSIVQVKSKLNLSLKSLNDKVWINLDRLYGRFGSNVRQKIGIINKISFNGRDTTVEFNDLGNVFNRSLNIAPDDAVNYSVATDEAKLYNGHIVSNDSELPDANDEDSGFTQRLV